jgi:small subunit ribosomal protein S2
MRAIHLYCDLVSGAVLDGLQAELAASGIDVGARAELPGRVVPDEDELGDEPAPEALGEEIPAEPAEAEQTTAGE